MIDMDTDKNNALVVFEDKNIRRVWYDDEWYFSVVDVIAVLTDSINPSAYWRKLKERLKLEGNETVTKCHTLKIEATDGKMRQADVVSTAQIFRLLQSIPSKNAEPFKLWLAQVGYERIEEIEDPELAFDRAMQIYFKKGYSKEWINQRLKTIEVRKELTDEWNRVGIEKKTDYAQLTNIITKAWSEKTIKEYKQLKNLKKENLRDNMTNLELVLNMLAETTTTVISKKEDPKTFSHSKNIAKKGGNVAGNTRKDIEMQLGENIVTHKTAKQIHSKKTKSINFKS